MKQTTGTIENILSAIAGLVPEYLKNPVDRSKVWRQFRCMHYR